MQIRFRMFPALLATSLILACPVLAGQDAATQADPAGQPAASSAPVAPADQPAVTQSQPAPVTPAEVKVPTESAPPATAPATPVAAPAEKAEFAYLVCYREKRFVGAVLNTSVYIDDTEIADLDNGCYIIVKVKAGEHKIRADEKKDSFTVNVEAGKTYYYRMELTWGLWKGHGLLKQVDNAEGEKQFKEWKLEYAPDIRMPDMIARELPS
jgi:hypothetical protein